MNLHKDPKSVDAAAKAMAAAAASWFLDEAAALDLARSVVLTLVETDATGLDPRSYVATALRARKIEPDARLVGALVVAFESHRASAILCGECGRGVGGPEVTRCRCPDPKAQRGVL